MIETPRCPYAILFIDDEPQARKYFRIALDAHYDVVLAGGVDEAIQCLAEHAPRIGVIVSDQRMPGKNGVELLRHARDHYPGIVRLLTTAYSDLADAIDAVNRGEILRYLSKPWDLPQLQVEMRQAMDYFLLGLERDRLIAEKLSVRRLEQRVQQFRDLTLTVASVARSRFRLDAVRSLLDDALRDSDGIGTPPTPIDREWAWATDSLTQALALGERLEHWRQVPDGFDDRIDGDSLPEVLAAALGATAPSAEPATPRVCGPVIQRVIAGLASLVPTEGPPPTLHITDNSAQGLDITVEGLTLPTPLLDADTGLWDVYLGVHHHGGSVQCSPRAGRIRCLLPTDPGAVTRPAGDQANDQTSDQDTAWLADLLTELQLLTTEDP